MQLASGNATSVVVEYNTSVQTPQATAAGEGYQLYDNSSGGTVNDATIAYNTMIATGGAAGTAVSYFLHGGGSTDTATAIYDNYFDTTAAYGAFYSGSFTGASIYNNVDMNTGKIIQANDFRGAVHDGVKSDHLASEWGRNCR